MFEQGEINLGVNLLNLSLNLNILKTPTLEKNLFYMQSVSPIKDYPANLYRPTSSVLVISRARETRCLFREILKMWRYQVLEAENAENISHFNARQDLSVILMEMDFEFGNDLVNFCKLRTNKKFRKTPIILVSGFPHPKCRSVAFAIGANEYLVKPIDYDLLENLLNKFTKNRNLPTI